MTEGIDTPATHPGDHPGDAGEGVWTAKEAAAEIAFSAYHQGYRDACEDSGEAADMEAARDGWHDWLHDCEALKDGAYTQTPTSAPAGDGARREAIIVTDAMRRAGGLAINPDADVLSVTGHEAECAYRAMAALSTQATDREKVLEEAATKLLDAYSAYFPAGNPWADEVRRALAQAPSEAGR